MRFLLPAIDRGSKALMAIISSAFDPALASEPEDAFNKDRLTLGRSWWIPSWVIAILLIAPLPSYGLEAEISVEVKGSFQPTISGRTTLPDGMKLAVRVKRKESAFEYETSSQVEGGKFSAGPISQRGGDLNPGTYNLEVVCEDSSDQPEAVSQLLGRKWQKLEGPLVKKRTGTVTVRFATTFELGQTVDPELDRAARQHAELSKTRWWRKNCDEICSGAELYAQRKTESFDRERCIKTCIANPPTVR